MSRAQLGSKVGLYGKLPIFGDFVVRHLNTEFVSPWDSWLQDSLADSRQMLGSAWLNYYLVAPIWRFVIGPGVLGDSAWIGVMVPSVDRVGRYFPLTLIQPMDLDIDITATYLANSKWFQLVESLGADALRHDLDFEEYESKLRGLPAPVSVIDINAGDETIPALKKVFLSSYFCMPLDGNCGDCVSQVRDAISVSMQPASLWGAELLDNQEHVLLATEALPTKKRFCALLDKYFEEHGWIDATKRHQVSGLSDNLM